MSGTSAARPIVTSVIKTSQNDGTLDGMNSTPVKTHQSSKSYSPVRDRKRHHCRACGQAVCDECSQGRRPVPERGWTTDVRVCDCCNKKYKSE